MALDFDDEDGMSYSGLGGLLGGGRRSGGGLLAYGNDAPSKMQIFAAMLQDLGQNASGKTGSAIPALGYRMAKIRDKAQADERYRSQMDAMFNPGTPEIAPYGMQPDGKWGQANGGINRVNAGPLANSPLAQYRPFFEGMDPDKGSALMLSQAIKEPDAPAFQTINGKVYEMPRRSGEMPRYVMDAANGDGETRKIEDGNYIITQEKGANGQWRTIAKAPRWQPQASGGGMGGVGVPGLGAGWKLK